MSADRGEMVSLVASLFACVTLAPVLMHGFAGALSYRVPAVAAVVSPGYASAKALVALQREAAPAGNAQNSGAQTGTVNQNPGQLPKEPKLLLPSKKIAELAVRTWKAEPLDSNAIRALAYSEELAGRKDAARRLMNLALERSLHDHVARYWLLRDAVERKDFDGALLHLDMFFRTSRQVTTKIMTSFAALADHPTGQKKIIAALKTNPPWRRPFLLTYPAIAKNLDGPMKIFVALKAAGSEPEKEMIHALENNLVNRGKFGEAYYAWLQTLSPEELKNLPLLNNGSFDAKPSKSAFAWRMRPTSGAQSEIGQFASGNKYGNSLQVVFFGERVRYAHTRQLTMLTPGKYTFSGEYRLFNINNSRGLVWRVLCLAKRPIKIGESLRMRGHMVKWNNFQFEFDVPEKNCGAQIVQLALAARNSPESIISGRALFDNLRIDRR